MSARTNSIGAGMLNVSLPLPEREAIKWHRLAGQKTSRVKLIREVLLEGARVRFPEVAQEIEQIRKEHWQKDQDAADALKDTRPAHLQLKFGFVCLLIGAFAVFGSHDLRLARTFKVRSGSARVSRREVA
jgi:hypothetical protein